MGKQVRDPNTGKLVDKEKEDVITVGLKPIGDDALDDIPYRRVLRSRFTLNTINSIFDCTAVYMQDQFGNIVWPKDWKMKLLPETKESPWKYVIVQSEEKPGIDETLNHQYSGEAMLVLKNVPSALTMDDIREYLLYGLAVEDPLLLEQEEKVEIQLGKQKVLMDKQLDIPNMSLDGNHEQQQEMREKLAQSLATHLEQVNAELKVAKRIYRRRKHALASEPMKIERVHRNSKAEELDWYVQYKSPRAEQLTRTTLEKTSWHSIKFAKRKNKCIVTLDDLPDEFEKHIINLRMIEFKRIKHGDGTLVGLLDEEDDVLDEDFHVSSVGSMYNGHWKDGVRQGKGTEFTNAGLYEGEFQRNLRRGKGKLLDGKGNTYIGQFECPHTMYEQTGKPYRYSSVNPQDYREGVENGMSNLTFADGATYQGEMADGHVTGYGRYESSAGVIEEGYFYKGQLHGEGFRTEPNGHHIEGHFQHGELCGQGYMVNVKGDTYRGSFEDGVPHGRGVSIYKDGIIHRGFWKHGERTGLCTMFFGNLKNSTEHDPWGSYPVISDYTYRGRNYNFAPQRRHYIQANNSTASKSFIPFTTEGYVSSKFQPIQDSHQRYLKIQHRHQKNANRRIKREVEYLANQGRENLQKYFDLLDEKFENWAENVQEKHEYAALTPRTIAHRISTKQEALKKTEQESELRDERRGLAKTKITFQTFESNLQRIPLTEFSRMENILHAS